MDVVKLRQIEGARRMRLQDIVNTRPVVVGLDATAGDVARQILDYNSSFVIVIDDFHGKPVGIVTERDFLNLVASHGSNETKIVDIMSAPLLTLPVDATRDECIDFMKRNGIKHVVVTRGDDLVGVVSLKELLFDVSPIMVETHPFALYVIFKDTGLLLYEFDFRVGSPGEKKVSGDLFSGAFASFNTLIPEVLGSEGNVKFIEIEDKTVLIEYGERIIVIIVQDKESIDSRKRLQNFKRQFESMFRDVLDSFTPSTPVDGFKKADEIVKRVFSRKLA